MNHMDDPMNLSYHTATSGRIGRDAWRGFVVADVTADPGMEIDHDIGKPRARPHVDLSDPKDT